MQSNGEMGQGCTWGYGNVMAQQRGVRRFPMRPVAVACWLAFAGTPIAYAANCTATSESSLASCIAGASSGNTITLGANINLASVPASMAGGAILNTNGYTLSTPGTGWIGTDSVLLTGGGALIDSAGSTLLSNPVEFATNQTGTIGAAAGTTLNLGTSSGLVFNNGSTVVIGSSTATGMVLVNSLSSTIYLSNAPKLEVAGGTLRAGSFNLGNLMGNFAEVKVDAGATFDMGGFNAGVANLQGAGTVATGGAALTVNAGNFSGAITGSGGLEKSTGGTLVLSGTNTYAGTTTISGGTLQVGAGGASGSLGTGNVTDNGALVFNRSDTVTVANGISGGGSVTQAGSGTVILTGANSYSGGTTINAGSTLQVGNGGNSGSLGSGNIVDNGALAFNRSDTVSVTAAISGSGSVSQNGSGTLELSGTNTYSGGTAINAGTVSIDNGSALGTGAVTLHAGKLLSTSSLTLANNISVAGGANATIAAATGTTLTHDGALSLGSNATAVFGASGNAGTVLLNLGGGSGLSASSALRVAGGTLQGGTSDLSTLTAFASSTTVDAGATLQYLSTGSIKNLQGAGTVNSTGLSVASGNFSGVIAGTGGLAKTGSGTLVLSGNNTYSGGTTISAGGILQVGNGGTSGSLGSGNITDNGALAFNRTDALTVAGNISGTGTLTHDGVGTLTLSGNNSYSGATNVNSGTLRAGSYSAFSSNSAFTLGAAATLDLANFNQDIASLSGVGNVTLGLATVSIGAGGASTTYNGVISGGGGVTKNGAGTFTLTGANTYSGATSVNGGTLRSGAAGAFATGSAYTVGGSATLDLNGFDQSIGSLAGGGNVTLGSATLTTGDSSTSYSGIISGSGGLTKVGIGTFTLTGTNSYSGTTTISGGTLQVGDGGGTGTLGSGNIVDNGALVFNRSNAYAVTVDISGTGTLSQNGSGILTVSGTNTYSGVTNVNAGTLRAGTAGAFSTNSAVTLAGGSTLDLNNFNQSIASLAGSGNVTLGSATLTTGGGNTNTSFAGAISGSGGVTKNGSGTLTLSGANTYSGTTNVNTGTLQAGATNTFASNSAYTLATGTTLDLNNFNQSIASLTGSGNVTLGSAMLTTGGGNTSTVLGGVISGSGGVTKSGTGTLILTGTNTYSGTTTIDAGTLQLGNGGSTGALGNGDIVDNGVLDITRSDALTLSNAISGTGGLTKNGSGTLTLTGTNTYSGATNVSTGSLIVNGSIAGQTNIASGTSLGGSGSVGSVNIASGGTLTPGNSIGTLTVNGNLQFAAGSTYRVEADAAGNADRTNVGGTLTLQGGTVSVQAGAGTYARNTTYTILSSTGTTTGAFAAVTSNLAFLTPTLIYQSNAVLLKLSSSSAQSYASVAQTPIQLSVASYLDTFANAPGNAASAQLIQQLDNLNATQARTALDALSGRQNNSAPQLVENLGRGVQTLLMGRSAFVGEVSGPAGALGNPLKYASVELNGLSSASSALAEHPYRINATTPGGGAASGWTPARSGVWTQAMGSVGQLAADGNMAGVRYRTSGVLTGYDSPMGKNGLMGVALGYSASTWDASGDNAAPASGGIESPMAALYGSYTAGPWQLRVSTDWTDHAITAQRTIVLGGTSVANTSSHHGQAWGLGGEAEYVPPEAADWQVRPVLGLRYANWNEDAYTEGGNAATALSVQSRRSETTTASAGLRLVHPFEDGSGGLELRGTMSYMMGADDTPATASMGGQGGLFSISSTPLQRAALTLGAGVVKRMGRNVDGYAESSYEVRGAGQAALSAIVGLRLAW